MVQGGPEKKKKIIVFLVNRLVPIDVKTMCERIN